MTWGQITIISLYLWNMQMTIIAVLPSSQGRTLEKMVIIVLNKNNCNRLFCQPVECGTLKSISYPPLKKNLNDTQTSDSPDWIQVNSIKWNPQADKVEMKLSSKNGTGMYVSSIVIAVILCSHLWYYFLLYNIQTFKLHLFIWKLFIDLNLRK